MVKVKGIDTFVRDCGEGDAVLLLHGWGGSSASMVGLMNSLQSQYRVVVPDFWGFGQSANPSENFTIYDYAEYIYELLQELKINKVHIIGHSFGGRVGIIIASMHPKIVKSLILIDSAGIKPKMTYKKRLQIMKYKKVKSLVEQGKLSEIELKKFGSTDYKVLDDNMKNIFVNIVNEDLSNIASDIQAPTILIWGRKDTETPIYMAKKLQKIIKYSKLYLLNGGHYAYLTQQSETLKICYSFWEAL